MNENLTNLTILLAGLGSFISPCVLPLVPPYLSYLAGVSIDQLSGTGGAAQEAGEKRRLQLKVFLNAVLFVLGFSTVFISLGAGASTIGHLVRAHLDVLSTIAGLVIILMGMHFLGLLKIGLLYRELRFQTGGVAIAAGGEQSTSPAAMAAGSYVMGLAFAFGWTPCIGPILGAVLAVAGTRESVGQGAVLLAIYSAGLGIPFLLAAFFVNPFMRFLNRFRRYLGMVEKVMGGLLVLTGILFLTGGMQTMSYWLLEKFPVLSSFG